MSSKNKKFSLECFYDQCRGDSRCHRLRRLPSSSSSPTQRPAMRFSGVTALRRSKSKEISAGHRSLRTLYTRACTYIHARPRCVYPRTSARTRRRTTGVARFRQSNDNDRNVEGNRLHAVKMRRAARNIEERSRFNVAGAARKRMRRVLFGVEVIGAAVSLDTGREQDGPVGVAS